MATSCLVAEAELNCAQGTRGLLVLLAWVSNLGANDRVEFALSLKP